MNTTRDALLGGRVFIQQPESGFRAGTDSILLAASLPIMGSVLEAGCGAGGALFPAMWRMPDSQFVGVEQDAAIADLAGQGAALNGFQGRCEIACRDLAQLPASWENRFDMAFSNPPYFQPGQTSAPGAGKDGAYIAQLGLNAWVRQMLFAVRPKGWVVVIHRAAELSGLLAALDRRAGEITVLPVRPRAGAEAKRVIIRARKGLKRGPARLLDGLELDDAARMAAIMEGSGLEWM